MIPVKDDKGNVIGEVDHYDPATGIVQMTLHCAEPVKVTASLGLQVEIDPNVRVQHNWTVAGFEHVRGDPERLRIDGMVEVVEDEAGFRGLGRVKEIDPDKKIVWIEVPWEDFFGSLPADDGEE